MLIFSFFVNKSFLTFNCSNIHHKKNTFFLNKELQDNFKTLIFVVLK